MSRSSLNGAEQIFVRDVVNQFSSRSWCGRRGRPGTSPASPATSATRGWRAGPCVRGRERFTASLAMARTLVPRGLDLGLGLECWQQTKDVYGPQNISRDTLYHYRCWDYFVTFIILMRPSQDNDLPCKCWDLFDIIYIYLPNHFIVPKQWMFKCLKTVNLLFKLNYILRNQN